MPRTSQHPKQESFNFRLDPIPKADFQRATEAEDRTEARRQSRLIAARAADPRSDEAEVMRWIEDVAGTHVAQD